MRAYPSRPEDPERLGDLRVLTAIEPAQVDRRTRMELDQGLAAATPAHQRDRPPPDERVERIGPAEVHPSRGLGKHKSGVDATRREIV